MSDQLKDDLYTDIRVLLEVAPATRLLNLKQDIMPMNFENVVSDFYNLQNYIETLERKLK
jgi:hypothetical protein